jgi:hypothetical protein
MVYVMDVMHAKFVLIQLWMENAQIGVKKNACLVLCVMDICQKDMEVMVLKVEIMVKMVLMEDMVEIINIMEEMVVHQENVMVEMVVQQVQVDMDMMVEINAENYVKDVMHAKYV